MALFKSKKAKAIKEPKDIDLKIGSVEEQLWQRVLDNATNMLKQAEESVVVQKEVANLARRKVGEARIAFQTTKVADVKA